MTQPVWNTSAGTLGTFPAGITAQVELSASPTFPAVDVSFKRISGELPPGITLSSTGLLFGIPQSVSVDETFTFGIRATDDLGNIKDRTFSMLISGTVKPELSTPPGFITNVLDSTWVEIPIAISNPVEDNPITVRVVSGRLPPGLEINERGLIRGYPARPVLTQQLPRVTTSVVSISDNKLTALSTSGFSVGRPVVFSGTVFGNVIPGQTYYIQSIIDNLTFTISETVSGPALQLSNSTGDMTATLPETSVGQAIIETYSFTLRLESPLGNDSETYSITVTNQNTPISRGGPGLPRNTRPPTIYNTRPPVFDISQDPANFSYFILPDDSGTTFVPSEPANLGDFSSDNFFSFRILGHDFDSNTLEYVFFDLPLGLTGDSSTGWITGTPIISENSTNRFSFSVLVRKANNPGIASPRVNFSFRLKNNIIGDVDWITLSELGQILNGTISTLRVEAKSDVPLEYRIVEGKLPPNLRLLPNGEISGKTSFQPENFRLAEGDKETYVFSIEAFSPQFPIVTATRTFTLDVSIEYKEPFETLYIKCSPSIKDRDLLRSLLTDKDLIPDEALYRPKDPFFGKSVCLTYEHAFGINASDFEEYVAAVTKNHYWRNIILGELKTAIARDDSGQILYEVVYSRVIDNLVNPDNVSVSKDVVWPRFINLNKGPWLTNQTDLFTSYGEVDGQPVYFTSLTPGFARTLHPNSLVNMRRQVGEELGQRLDFRLLPKWMTSQQEDGSTLGYVPAWVIAYTKPGFSKTIKENIENNWRDFLGDRITLNQINFKIDRFTVDKSATFNYDKNISPADWISLPGGTPEPEPLNSRDFFVLFPRQTILPDDTQFNK